MVFWIAGGREKSEKLLDANGIPPLASCLNGHHLKENDDSERVLPVSWRGLSPRFLEGIWVPSWRIRTNQKFVATLATKLGGGNRYPIPVFFHFLITPDISVESMNNEYRTVLKPIYSTCKTILLNANVCEITSCTSSQSFYRFILRWRDLMFWHKLLTIRMTSWDNLFLGKMLSIPVISRERLYG